MKQDTDQIRISDTCEPCGECNGEGYDPIHQAQCDECAGTGTVILETVPTNQFRAVLSGQTQQPTTQYMARQACRAHVAGKRRVARIQYRYADGWKNWDSVDTRTAWGRRRAGIR